MYSDYCPHECVAVNPVGLWPLTAAWGVSDVQGSHDGTAVAAGLDSNLIVDLSQLPQGVLHDLGPSAEMTLRQSFTFHGHMGSYVKIPNISGESSFTYVGFVWLEADQDGPLWHWDGPSGMNDHVWYVTHNNKLFYRQVDSLGVGSSVAAEMRKLHNLTLSSCLCL